MESIGVIGLGKMGKPMACRLIQAGYSVIVHSRSPEPVQEVVGLGAAEAHTPRDVASNADVIIMSLPDAKAVELVCLGENGIRDGARRNSVLIDTSTIDPETSLRIASALGRCGVEMLDAPVSGGQAGAMAGTLSIMVGGPEAAFHRVLPVLSHVGRTITHMGAGGTGLLTKLANQIIVAANYVAIGEGLTLGAKAGLDAARLIRALEGGLARSRCLELKGERIMEGNYEPTGRLTLHIKDLRYALQTAHSIGAPLPLTSMIDQWFQATRAAGRGDWDHSAVVTLFEDFAGIQIGNR